MRSNAPIVRVVDDLRVFERDWWADEVPEAFPSMRALVDRMRLAFFGGADPAATAWWAEVRLTAGQARRGGRVWVEVPVRRVCDSCGGRGESWAEPCPRCGGHGDGVRLQSVDVAIPPGVRDGTWLAFDLEVPKAAPVGVRVRVTVT